MDNKTLERIEKEAKGFAGGIYKRNHFPVHWNKAYEGYIAGATSENERSQQELQAYRDIIKELIPIADAVSDIYIEGYKAGEIKSIVAKAKLIDTVTTTNRWFYKKYSRKKKSNPNQI